jgi:hypothetical protein
MNAATKENLLLALSSHRVDMNHEQKVSEIFSW